MKKFISKIGSLILKLDGLLLIPITIMIMLVIIGLCKPHIESLMLFFIRAYILINIVGAFVWFLVQIVQEDLKNRKLN